MASNRVLVVACLVLVCMAVSAPEAKAQMTCNQVVNYLSPCISYVMRGGAPAATCCNGVRTLFSVARMTADRQTVCKCVKAAVSRVSYTNTNLQLAAALPSKCGLNIPYKIDPSTNCNNVRRV